MEQECGGGQQEMGQECEGVCRKWSGSVSGSAGSGCTE